MNLSRLFISTAVGVIVGALVLIVLRSEVPGLQDVVRILSYPGIRLGRLWTDAGLASKGAAAFASIALGILFQWTLLGFFVGCFWSKRQRA